LDYQTIMKLSKQSGLFLLPLSISRRIARPVLYLASKKSTKKEEFRTIYFSGLLLIIIRDQVFY